MRGFSKDTFCGFKAWRMDVLGSEGEIGEVGVFDGKKSGISVFLCVGDVFVGALCGGGFSLYEGCGLSEQDLCEREMCCVFGGWDRRSVEPRRDIYDGQSHDRVVRQFR
jgi:hypothetical protein